MKTYIINRFYFDLGIDNFLQEVILIISSLSSIWILLGISLFFSSKWKFKIVVLLSFMYTFMLYANIVYYRFFNDFITLPVLFQTNNVSDLGASAWSLLSGWDVLLFLDLVILLFLKKYILNNTNYSTRKEKNYFFITAVILLLVNIGLAEIERPQFLTRAFDRITLLKNLGNVNYQVYDTFIYAKTETQRTFSSEDELEEVREFVEEIKSPSNESFKGVAKGKNVFVISLESFQSFVLNREVENKKITPFLNQLIRESYYFPNFYHQTGQGKTSDSEFLVDNSLFPTPRGAVFFTHPKNEYNSIAENVKEKGYFPAVFHANNESFWNRNIMYPSLGYEKFFSKSKFETKEKDTIGWGLKDEAMFEQSIHYLKSLPEPYYVKYITLTNHFPFELEKEDRNIPKWDSNDEIVNNYFTTVRYTDDSLRKFFNRLKEEGIYEDSIFIIYGDHYGLSEKHYGALGEYLGEEITPFQATHLQKVPLLIHFPGKKGKTIDNLGGQIDLKPTIRNLLGIEDDRQVEFGNDLFSSEQDNLVIFRDGSFVTKDYVYAKSTCYRNPGGEKVDVKECEPYQKKANKMLRYSDKIVYGDLLRFSEQD
jgi:lipoteichoic acid synthase